MNQMRQIKFRGKTQSGEWAYGSLLKWENGDCEIMVQKSPIDCDKLTVIPDTVGQFTGLLDKNGKEVYEGDIIKDELGLIGKICWDDGYLQWFTLCGSGEPDLCASWSPCEVVGNNFDNPELMEGGEE